MTETSKTLHTLDNGLNVLLYRNAKIPGVGVAIGVKYGCMYDPKGKEGLAHLVEHMVFTGTPTRTYQEIVDSLSKYTDIEYDAETQNESTVHYIGTTRQKIYPVLAVYADMLRNPTFTEKALSGRDGRSGERNVVWAEREKFEQVPANILSEELWKAVFKEHPAGDCGHGTAESLKSITTDDLFDVHRRYYTPDNMIVVIAGELKQAPAMKAVEKYFGDMKGNANPAQVPIISDFDAVGDSIILQKPNLREHMLGIGFRTIPMSLSRRKDEHAALSLIAYIIKDQLYNELRVNDNRGLHYSLHEVNQYQGKHYGLFAIEMGFPNYSLFTGEESQDLEKSKAIVWKVLNRIYEGAISKKEIVEKKDFFIKELKYNSERNPLDAALTHTEHYIQTGSPFYTEDFISRVERMTPEYVRSIAGRYLDPKTAVTVTIIPKKGEEDKEPFMIPRTDVDPAHEKSAPKEAA